MITGFKKQLWYTNDKYTNLIQRCAPTEVWNFYTGRSKILLPSFENRDTMGLGLYLKNSEFCKKKENWKIFLVQSFSNKNFVLSALYLINMNVVFQINGRKVFQTATNINYYLFNIAYIALYRLYLRSLYDLGNVKM